MQCADVFSFLQVWLLLRIPIVACDIESHPEAHFRGVGQTQKWKRVMAMRETSLRFLTFFQKKS